METIKVVMVEPGKTARITEIGEKLEDLQEAVGGGFIETFYPFEEDVCIVCNDEGKVNGMEACRAIYLRPVLYLRLQHRQIHITQ